MADATDAEFDWGDESSLHRVGRGLRVVLAFVVVAVVVAAIAAVWSMIFGVMSGSAWLGLFGAAIVLLAIAGAVELVVQSRRREAERARVANAQQWRTERTLDAIED